MRPLRAQLIAVLTVLAVLLPGSAFARAQYFCRMMDRVVATCCCDADSGHRDGPSCAVQVRPTDCCEKITTGTRSATLKAISNELSIPSAAIASTVPAPVHLFPRAVEGLILPRQARAPPGVGPPLFIVHCSLLT
jgi:hypothetical protein